jgi:signal transduction histidine kinase/HAMP domain-containing protein
MLFGLVAVWTIQETVEAAYRERQVLTEVLARNTDEVLGYALDALDREATAFPLEPDQPLSRESRENLTSMRMRLASYSAIGVTDTRGTLLWSEPDEAAPTTDFLGVQECAKLTGQRDETRLVETVALNGQRAWVCLTAPLRGVDDRFTGRLIALLDPTRSNLHLVPQWEMGEGIHIQLVDAGGRLVVGKELGVPSEVSHLMSPGHRALLGEFIDTQRSGFAVHAPRAGQNFGAHVVAYAPLKVQSSWGVVFEQPQDVVVTVPRRLQVRLGLFGLAALFIVVAIAWFDVRRVVRPLRLLTGVAGEFAAGRLDEPVDVRSRDEVGVLAQALETMRQRLRGSLEEVAEWNRELERRVAARTAEVERQNRDLAHLNDIASTVSGSFDVKPMLTKTLEHIREITRAPVGAFWVVDDTTQRFQLMAEYGLPEGMAELPACFESCLCGQAACANEIIVANGSDLHPETHACHATGLESVIAVPLPAGGRPHGILFLGSRQRGHFHPDAMVTLAAIGRQVGVAVASAQLYQRLRAREHERAGLLQRIMDGQEEERRRLAQELHDETSQALTSLRLGLEQLATTRGDQDQVARLANQLQEVAAQAQTDVHRLAVELRPSVLDDVGLVAAIARYVDEYGPRWNLAVDFAPVGVDGFRLIPAAETAIYRIIQAALTNIAEHARANRISVLLQRRGNLIIAVVEDDGQGFDLAQVRASSIEARLGLAGMEERAALIGATLTIETSPGSGTTVYLQVPLSQNTHQEEKRDETTHFARR